MTYYQKSRLASAFLLVAALIWGTNVWANDSGENAVERAKNYFSDEYATHWQYPNPTFYCACFFFTASQHRDDVKAGVKLIETAKIEVVETKRVDGTSHDYTFDAVRVTFSDKSVRYYVPGVLGTVFDDVSELNSPTRSARLIGTIKHETDLNEYLRLTREERAMQEKKTFVTIWRSASKIKNTGNAQLDLNLTVRDILAAIPLSSDQNKYSDENLLWRYNAIKPNWEAVSAELEKSPEATK